MNDQPRTRTRKPKNTQAAKEVVREQVDLTTNAQGERLGVPNTLETNTVEAIVERDPNETDAWVSVTVGVVKMSEQGLYETARCNATMGRPCKCDDESITKELDAQTNLLCNVLEKKVLPKVTKV